MSDSENKAEEKPVKVVAHPPATVPVSIPATVDVAVRVEPRPPIYSSAMQYLVIGGVFLGIVVSMLAGVVLAPSHAASIITSSVAGMGIMAGMTKLFNDQRDQMNGHLKEFQDFKRIFDERTGNLQGRADQMAEDAAAREELQPLKGT